MNGSSTSLEKRQLIEQQAAELYLKTWLSGTDEDWAAAYSWIEKHPSHGVAFAKAEANWEITNRLGEVAPAIVPEAIAGPAGRFEAMFERRGIFTLLAAALLGTMGTIGIQKWAEIEHFRTTIGQQKLLRLTDGSTIYLNTNSAVEIAIHDDSRFVRLVQGEAQFDVARFNKAPFVIQTGTTTLRTQAGALNVRVRSELTELTVMTGQVAVRDGSEVPQRVVQAGDGAAIRGAVAVAQLSPEEVAQRTSWRNGYVRFDGDTLGQAVEEFNRYSDTPLIIGDPRLAALRVDGTFGVNRSRDLLVMLKSEFGIQSVPTIDNSILLLPSADR